MTTDSTWLALPRDSGFGPANLPLGVYRPAGSSSLRVGTRIGESVLDLAAAAAILKTEWTPLFATDSLNPFLAAGPEIWSAVRSSLRSWLTGPQYERWLAPLLTDHRDTTMVLPFEVADYVDFYSSEDHARNAGGIFRPGLEPLTPNWKHLPIGYHGRSGTVVASGTRIVRPQGLRILAPDVAPTFGPTGRLDIEAEIGFVVGRPSTIGTSVPIRAFDQHVFGVCLVNDWSARDIQAFEYVPLGPFLGKSFATSISPWVVPLDALSAARAAPPKRDVPVADHLDDRADPWGLDIALEIRLNGQLISEPPFAGMYWTAAQQLAHLTSGGASLRTGDLYASGTVSGPARNQRGSLLELAWGGSDPIRLTDGSTRSFLLDGDYVEISATAPGTDGERLSFGSVTGTVSPAGSGGSSR